MSVRIYVHRTTDGSFLQQAFLISTLHRSEENQRAVLKIALKPTKTGKMSSTIAFAAIAVVALAAVAFAIYVKIAKQRGETARNVAARGNLVVLMGPNGAGKTVLFHQASWMTRRPTLLPGAHRPS